MTELAVRSPRTAGGNRAVRPRWPAAALAAAVLSIAAGWIHFAFMTSHWSEWWAYGAFFLATGVFQAAFAPAVLRWPGPWTALLGIAGNLAIVGMYVLSRTNGVPMGPHTGVVERAAAVDLACTAGEIALVGVLLSMLRPTTRRLIADALVLAGVSLWVLRLTDHLN